MKTLFCFEKAVLGRRPGFVLPPLDWRLRSGEHWAIVGPTGSGKTLLLDTLSGRWPILGGTFTHAVGPLRTTVENVAKDYGFDRNVAQVARFYQQRFNADAAREAPTVRNVLQEQVRPPGTVAEQSVVLPDPAYPDEWLREVANWGQIAHLLDRHLTSLSNGETRRTLLARSLLRRPEVLLLDNPFVGLDVDSRWRLHQILDQMAQAGTTLVLVTTAAEIPHCITHVLALTETGVGWQGPKAHWPGLPWPGQSNPSAESLTNETLLTRWLAAPPAPFAYAVRMRGVSVAYGSNVVIDNLHWSVRRGDKWAVLGPNGSGKSTLLSLITADNPQAYRNDYDLFDRKRGTGESIWDIKRNLGFVSPELHLYFGREQSVWNVVTSGLFDTAGLFRKLSPEQADQTAFALDLLRLQPLRHKRLDQLSTGQQRWVLLARALIKNPVLLILDEPCQGLDAAHTNRFRDLIDELCQSADRTLLYVSHYADEIPRCVTQVLRLTNGRGHIDPIGAIPKRPA